MPKNVQTTTQLALISHTSKIMLKILQASLWQYMNQEVPDVQAGSRKGRGTRDQIANIQWIIQKAKGFKKNIYFCFIDYAKAFVWITINCGKILKGREHQITLPASWESCMQVKKLQLKPDMKQWSGSKLGMQYAKAVCCHPACIIYMQTTSCEMLSWMNPQARIKIVKRNINKFRSADDIILMAESEEELKSLLMMLKEKSEKADLKVSVKKLRSWHPDPLLHGK